ncbi:MAG: proline/glycine betaine ABC transporter permease, partial [Euryarchaeota archaeon]|nr:proline/glycine betaine ABC transporter permease [Euryarchaeota archaeon]
MIPKIPLGEWVELLVDWIAINLGFLLDGISSILEWILDLVSTILGVVPSLALILILAVLAYFLSKKVLLSVGVALGLFLIDNMGLWDLAMETLSLVLVAAGVAVIIGIPLGIAAS